jgi:hypothetical protein
LTSPALIGPGSILAAGRYIVIRDTDIEPLPTWLADLLDADASPPAAGATASGEVGKEKSDRPLQIAVTLARQPWRATLSPCNGSVARR